MLDKNRITDLEEATELEEGYYIMLDSPTLGTRIFDVNNLKPDNDLYRWDFTKSLIDEKQGKEATLLGSATRGSEGVTISDKTGVIDFLGNDSVSLANGICIEFNFKEITISYSSSSQSSSYVWGDGSNNDGYYFHNNGNLWKMYFSRSQRSSSISWSEEQNKNAFTNGGIIKFEIKNQVANVYYNDNLIQSFDNYTMSTLWGRIGKQYGPKSAHVMTIKSIRIYENEEV